MSKKPAEGVPALQNDQVTGMTEERQEEIIEQSGRGPRKGAAKRFFQEEGEQARTTSRPGDQEEIEGAEPDQEA